MTEIIFSSRFVTLFPDTIEERVIYISMEYATAVHKCPCGCGKEVVTAFTPTDWSLHFDGETVSLEPSVGNWNFPCRSHYYIRRGRVRWAGNMSPEAIERGREKDRESKRKYYNAVQDVEREIAHPAPLPSIVPTHADTRTLGIWKALKAWFGER